MDNNYSSNANLNRIGDIIVGLDIGTTKIATIVGYFNNQGKIEILGYGKSESNGVQYGLIQNILKTSASIKKSVQSAAANSHYDEISNVYVGIAARHINSTNCKHYMIRERHQEIIQKSELDTLTQQVENIALPAGQQIIATIPQKYIIEDGTPGNSHESDDPVGETGSKITGCYQIITGKISEIAKIEQCITDVNLNIENLILEPIASGLSCLSEDDKNRGVALLDIGGGTTDLVIFKDGHPVFCKVIPIGGSVITNDIAKVCNISRDLAENLKKTHGSCTPERTNPNQVCKVLLPNSQTPLEITVQQIAKIIHSRVKKDIIGNVNKAIEESGYRNIVKNGAGLVITGGGANLKNLKQLCEFELGIQTNVGIPTVGFSGSLPNELKQPMYATSLGLLKYGLMSQNLDSVEQQSTTEENTKSKTKKPKTTGESPKIKDFWSRFKNSIYEIFEQIS